MAHRTVELAELKSLVGQEVGVSEWHRVTQDDINAFAEVTQDRQWIHVDPERAKRESPFGTTVAHGYFTLSLVSCFFEQVLEVTGASASVNYGLNRVRFPAPVPAGSRIRGRVVIQSVKDIPGGFQAVMGMTVELEGSKKPACVAECVSLCLF